MSNQVHQSSSPTELISEFFDIPESWAIVYYQLLKSGSGTIGQVILTGKVDLNRQQVYNILDKLVAMDLVTIISQSKRGNVYMANTPETATKTYLHKLDISLTKKKEKQDQFITDINHFLTLDDSPSIQEMSFQGQVIPKDMLADTFTDLIDQTIRTFKIAVKDFSMGMMRHIQPAIQKAFERESTVVHLLFEKTNLSETFKSRLTDGSFFKNELVQNWLQSGRLKIRFTKHLNQNFFLFDDVIFLLVFSSIEEIDFSFITRVDTITHRFKTKFDKYFAEGDKFTFNHA